MTVLDLDIACSVCGERVGAHRADLENGPACPRDLTGPEGYSYDDERAALEAMAEQDQDEL